MVSIEKLKMCILPYKSEVAAALAQELAMHCRFTYKNKGRAD